MSAKRKTVSSNEDEDTKYKRTKREMGSGKQTYTQEQQSVFHIEKILPTLEKEALMAVITNLLELYPQLNEKILSLLPCPTISTIHLIISSLESKLTNTFPYSKNGPDRSDYSYSRTRPVLEEISQTVLNYLPFFTNKSSYTDANNHEYPANSIAYLNVATDFIHRLPVWDSENFNCETHRVYNILSKAWVHAICEIGYRVKENGKFFGSLGIQEWEGQIRYHNDRVNGHFGFNMVVDIFERELGWMRGSAYQNHDYLGKSSLGNVTSVSLISAPQFS